MGHDRTFYATKGDDTPVRRLEEPVVKRASTATLRLLLVSLVALVVAFAALVRFTYSAEPEGTEVSLDRVYRLAAAGQVVSATILDQDSEIVAQVCDEPVTTTEGATPGAAVVVDPERVAALACRGRLTTVRAPYPGSDVATQALIEAIARPKTGVGAPVAVDPQPTKGVAKLLVTFVLPLVFLANLFGLILTARGGDRTLADIAGFGRIGRARQRKRRAGTGVSFADVAGAEEAVAELREVTDYLADPKRFEAYGAIAPKGVLLFGAPGCGKTLLARAVAGESGVPFFSISGAEFVESLVGVGAARVRDLFAQVRAVAPAIVFIDEIDAVGRRRGIDVDSGGEREQTLNQLLVEMDGFEVREGIVLMGATNRPDILDPALLRPGRFDRHVVLDPPDVHGRQAILELHARSRPVADDVDFAELARRTSGFTGADLANVVNEGALLALRAGAGGRIEAAHLSEAVLRVLHGPQRRGRILTAEEHKRLAYHEAGHALVAAALGRRGEVHRVSIVARGRGLAQTALGEEADRVLRTAPELEVDLAVALAGVAAEEAVFASSSTTAQDDVARATALAREMAGLYGMSPTLGRVAVLKASNGYLGGDGHALEAVSGQTVHDLDAEVRRLVDRAEETAAALLATHRVQLDAMAEALEGEETLEGAALEALLAPVSPEATLFAATPAPAKTPARRRPAVKG